MSSRYDLELTPELTQEMQELAALARAAAPLPAYFEYDPDLPEDAPYRPAQVEAFEQAFSCLLEKSNHYLRDELNEAHKRWVRSNALDFAPRWTNEKRDLNKFAGFLEHLTHDMEAEQRPRLVRSAWSIGFDYDGRTNLEIRSGTDRLLMEDCDDFY